MQTTNGTHAMDLGKYNILFEHILLGPPTQRIKVAIFFMPNVISHTFI